MSDSVKWASDWRAFTGGSSISELKRWLKFHRLDYGQCIEKTEFLSLIAQHGKIIDGGLCNCEAHSADSSSSSSSSGLSSNPTASSSSSSSSDDTVSDGYLLKTIAVGPLACNMSILADLKSSTRDTILVDPGGDAKKILDLISSMNVKIVLILITHGHFDHFLSAHEVHKATNAPVSLHSADLPLYKSLGLQLNLFGLTHLLKSLPQTLEDPQRFHSHDESLPILGGKVLHTPGHSPGSSCFLFPAPVNVLFSGDTLFKLSIGRTDLFGGDFTQIQRSIQDILYELPENIKVIPGHGEFTSIGVEKKSNMVVKAKKKTNSGQTAAKKPEDDFESARL